MPAHLKRELEHLKHLILSLGGLAEESVQKAVDSILNRDADLAKVVIENDMEIDRMEVEIEEECLKLMALYQPVAIDLRFIVAVLKLNSDLERIGDLSVNIAEHSVFLASQSESKKTLDFQTMGMKTKKMLEDSLEALVNLDSGLAHEVCKADDEVDFINKEMYSIAKETIEEDASSFASMIHLLSVSRHLERIADHATNIAEDVIYMVNGEITRHKIEEYK